MKTSDVVQIAKYAIEANNPLITIPVLFFIVFLGYCLAKKFFDTGYVTTSKEAREAQHQLITELQQEVERLNKKIKQLEEEKTGLERELDEAKTQD